MNSKISEMKQNIETSERDAQINLMIAQERRSEAPRRSPFYLDMTSEIESLREELASLKAARKAVEKVEQFMRDGKEGESLRSAIGREISKLEKRLDGGKLGASQWASLEAYRELLSAMR